MLGGEDGAPLWVDLAGRDGAVTSSGEALAPAAGSAAKEIEDIHAASLARPNGAKLVGTLPLCTRIARYSNAPSSVRRCSR
jgi:hypothetical protein